MKLWPRQFLSFRLILIALSLFSLMQMIAKELELRYSSFTVSDGQPVYTEPVLLSSFLVIASFLLLTKKARGRIVAIVLSGLVLYITLPLYFWHIAKVSEVQRYSRLHFSIWWENLDAGQILQIILAAVVLSFSTGSLASMLVRRRRSQSLYP